MLLLGIFAFAAGALTLDSFWEGTKTLQHTLDVSRESWHQHDAAHAIFQPTKIAEHDVSKLGHNRSSSGHAYVPGPSKPTRTENPLTNTLNGGIRTHEATVCEEFTKALHKPVSCVEIRGTHISQLAPPSPGWPHCCSVLVIVEPPSNIVPQNGAFVTNNSMVYHMDKATAAATIRTATATNVARILSLLAKNETQTLDARVLTFNSSMEEYINYSSPHLDLPEAVTVTVTVPRNKKRRGAVEADRLAKLEPASVTTKKISKSHATESAGNTRRLRAVFAVPNTMDVKELFAPNSVDVVYVRMRNDYCRAAQDMRSFWDVLRSGGVVFGDEYNQTGGSEQALQVLDVCGGW